MILKPLDCSAILVSKALVYGVDRTNLSPTTGHLELPALAGNIRLTTLEGTAEVLNGLTDVPLTPEKDSVGTSRGTESKLVKSEGLTTGGGDTLPGSGRESKSGDRELGNLGETLVVEDGANDDDDLGVVGVRVLGLLDDSRERNGGSVDLFTTRAQPSFVPAICLTTHLAHKQPLEDNSVELGVSPPSQESVELDKQEEIGVLRLGGRSVALLDVVAADVDTHL